jgi:hypothetical protein
MAKKKTKKKSGPIRYKIADLNELVKDGLLTQQDVDILRNKGRVIEPKKKEIRYVPGTTLIPHFSFINATKNEITPEAIALRIMVENVILSATVSKEEQDAAIKKAEDELKVKDNKKDDDSKPNPKKSTSKKASDKK